jgi:hypothetical protein
MNRKTGELFTPFAPTSRSGRYLRDLLRNRTPVGVEVAFDNILQTAFLDGQGREHNPTPAELADALQVHKLWRGGADVVVALSAAVRGAVQLVASRDLVCGSGRKPVFHFLDHPSYVMRRPRHEREGYAFRIAEILATVAHRGPDG